MRSEAAPSDWRPVVLDEVCSRVTSGGTPARDKGDRYYVAAGHRWVKTKELLDGQIHDSEEHITETALAESAARLLPPRTVLVAMYGATVGQLGILANEAACNQACCALLVDEAEADHRFVFYALLHNRWHLKQAASGAAQQNINARLIKNLRILLPPRDEQERIAWVLRALDDKIDSNLRLARLLEETVATLFRARFVDFLGIEEFEESEIGRIPRGWHVGSVYGLAEVTYGRPFKSSLFNDTEGTPLIRIRDLSSNEPSVLTPEVRSDSRLIRRGDIVVGMDGEFRAYAWAGPDSWLNQRVCAFDPRDGTPRAFLLEAIKRPLAFFEATKGGTTVIHLGKRDIDTFVTATPPPDVMREFGAEADPLLRLAVELRWESRSLSSIRDALLPKLISGQIRVPDIAARAEVNETATEALATAL